MKESIKDLFKKTFGVEPNSICEIAAHGSSRKYFRCQSEVVKVLAAYNGDKKENLAFIDFAKQLKAKGINVPAIIAVDEEKVHVYHVNWSDDKIRERAKGKTLYMSLEDFCK